MSRLHNPAVLLILGGLALIVGLIAAPQARAGVTACTDTFTLTGTPYQVVAGQPLTVTVTDTEVFAGGGNTPCAGGNVKYGTTNGTAIAPGDYTAISPPVAFSSAFPGSGSASSAPTQTFQVLTSASAVGSLNFTVALSSPTSTDSVFLGSPSSTSVTLVGGTALVPATTIPGVTATTTAPILMSPPSVVTGKHGVLFHHGAHITGTVNPIGLATTYQFEYGLTNAYGHTSTLRSLGADNATHHVSAYIHHLEVHQPYHYRLNATNAAGVTHGADHTFRTYRLSHHQKP